MLKRLKEIKWGKIFSTSVLISFILPIAFLIYKIITTTNEIDINNTDRTRSDYVLMLIQCLLGIVAMVLPEKASQKFKIQIPNNMYYLYVLFLYAAIFLGEIRNFYYTVPYEESNNQTFRCYFEQGELKYDVYTSSEDIGYEGLPPDEWFLSIGMEKYVPQY